MITQRDSGDLKQAVAAFWEDQSCGEIYAVGEDELKQFDAHAEARYKLEPFIFPFAAFETARDREVLEIGVGMGADHRNWAEASPRRLVGIDLTRRAVRFTDARLRLRGFQSQLSVADAETLPFPDDSFDIVYSWGVLHHSPNTARAIQEVRRVLKPGGEARIMVYHKHSIAGLMLWLRYAAMAGRWNRSFDDIYASHLESPGTKAYSLAEGRALFAGYKKVEMQVELSCGDLLEGEAGQRHRGRLLSIAKAIWPRPLIRSLLRNYGLFLMVRAAK